MLLNRLAEYAQNHLDQNPGMYILRPVKWLIDLDAEGNKLGITQLSDGKGGKSDRGKLMNLPHVMKSSGIKAKLLSDTSEYVLGISDAEERQERAELCHQAFVALLEDCLEKTHDNEIQTIFKFLEQGGLSPNDIAAKDIKPKDEITFRVAGVYPFKRPAIQDYWLQNCEEGVESKGQCVVCGKYGPVLQRIPHKIKKIPNGQSAGNSVISANKDPFESYGLKNSLVAATCPRCAENFSMGMNHLLDNKDSHIRVGPSVYIFWTKEESDFSIGNYFQSPDPTEVGALIRSAKTGESGNLELDEADFFAASLSASGSRVVVRDYLETTILRIKQKLAKWFELQKIVNTDGSDSDPIALYPLAASLYRDANKDMSPHVLPAMVGSALHGNPLPKWLLALAVRRNATERKVTRPRAAVIKMVLFSELDRLEENTMVELEKQSENQAYQLGRLMAVLEAIQKQAQRGIKSTITDRFYGSASTAPASVFGRLLAGSKAHLAKIRKEKEGLYHIFEKSLEGVCGQISSFPSILNLNDQGMFALGYYHQKADDRKEIESRRKNKENQ